MHNFPDTSVIAAAQAAARQSAPLFGRPIGVPAGASAHAPGHSPVHAHAHAVAHGALRTGTLPGQMLPPALHDSAAQALFGDLMRRVLDEMDYGVVMADAQGEVSFANRTARAEHASAGLRHLTPGERLVAGTSVETGELLRAVRDAVQLSRRSLVRMGTGLRQCVAVVPLSSEPAGDDGSGHALLLFGRRQVCAPISIAFFARTFGLTPTETQVLEALCQGETPAAIAKRNGVAVSTIRTQLSAVRQKTQTNSLRDLVRQVSTLPPIVCLSFGDATH